MMFMFGSTVFPSDAERKKSGSLALIVRVLGNKVPGQLKREVLGRYHGLFHFVNFVQAYLAPVDMEY